MLLKSVALSAAAIVTVVIVSMPSAEGRLIAGVNSLSELAPKLRQAVLLIEDKVAKGTTLEDAEALAAYARLARDTNGFNEFVQDAVA